MDLRFRSDLGKPEGSLALAACWNWKSNGFCYRMVRGQGASSTLLAQAYPNH
uniref:Uncharacterized protein n=1 Tax=Setaria italica TaxID=4555 RepID=K4AIC1_SETIT